MGKPRMIILIRHAQSEGNKNRDIHQSVPDHRVKITPEGWKQAEEAGRKLRSLLRPTDTLHFFTSPYRRTRETTSAILSSLTSPHPTPSPFPLHAIKVYEEPRLREQDFGNFQPCSAAMERMWRERADYGHFFYRIPNGESAADAYDRVSGFNESLWRGFGEEGFASVCVLVTHGLMARVFLMKWYHFSVEYFEDLRNVGHCEFVVMEREEEGEGAGKFLLRNRLRTWSELKREKSGKGEAEREGDEEGEGEGEGEVPVRRPWGGCPDGCDHGGEGGKRPPKRKNTADSFVDEVRDEMAKEELEHAGKRKLTHHHHHHHPGSNTIPSETANYHDSDDALEEKEEEEEGEEHHHSRGRSSSSTSTSPTNSIPSAPTDLDAANAAPPSSSTNPPPTSKPTKPRPRPRPLSPHHLAILETGRDGGGSRSGAASRSGSSDSEDHRTYHEAVGTQAQRGGLEAAFERNGRGGGEGGKRGRAEALGDWSVDEGGGEGGAGEDGGGDQGRDGGEGGDEGGNEGEDECEDEDEDEDGDEGEDGGEGEGKDKGEDEGGER